MNTNKGKHRWLKWGSVIAVIIAGICVFIRPTYSLPTQPQTARERSDQVVYISDLAYITTNNWSYNGWSGHAIEKDKNCDQGTIKLKVNGDVRSFTKGMGLHAKGQLTYDVERLSATYPRFVAKLGIDASKIGNKQSSVWFEIFTSVDGKTWTSVMKTAAMTPSSDAVEVDINIEHVKYLRIYVDPSVNGNGNDHGVLADAKLVTKDYVVNQPF